MLGSVGKSKVKTAGILVGQVYVMTRGRISGVVDLQRTLVPSLGEGLLGQPALSRKGRVAFRQWGRAAMERPKGIHSFPHPALPTPMRYIGKGTGTFTSSLTKLQAFVNR